MKSTDSGRGLWHNTRLQRTPLRAPLSRKPLDDER